MGIGAHIEVASSSIERSFVSGAPTTRYMTFAIAPSACLFSYPLTSQALHILSHLPNIIIVSMSSHAFSLIPLFSCKRLGLHSVAGPLFFTSFPIPIFNHDVKLTTTYAYTSCKMPLVLFLLIYHNLPYFPIFLFLPLPFCSFTFYLKVFSIFSPFSLTFVLIFLVPLPSFHYFLIFSALPPLRFSYYYIPFHFHIPIFVLYRHPCSHQSLAFLLTLPLLVLFLNP